MKKYLLFIVEGENDKREIQAMIRASCGKAFSENYVDEYHVHKNDITAEYDTTEKNIITRLNKIVIDWRNGKAHPFQRIRASDVEMVIQIVDTDGAFIPEDSIIEMDVGGMEYYDQAIYYYNPSVIIGRNRKKSRIIRKLIGTTTIDNIPYQIVFASCNMDHLLFDTRNPLPIDKGRCAHFFASECKNKAFLQTSVFAAGIAASGSFSDSWRMIQEGYNSLSRRTNLNIFFDNISEEIREEQGSTN